MRILPAPLAARAVRKSNNGFAVLGESDANDFGEVVPIAREIAESITPTG